MVDLLGRKSVILSKSGKSCRYATLQHDRLWFRSCNSIRLRVKNSVRVSFRFKFADQFVVLTWIPSHCGIPGNETTYRIPRTTANGTHDGPNTLTRTEASKWIFSIIKQKWNREYLKIPPGQHFKNFFPTEYQTGNLYDRPRRYRRIVFRLQTGHCRRNQYLFKIGVTDTLLCDLRRSEETVSLFLMFCSKFRFERRLITKAVRTHAISFTLKNILTNHRVLDAAVEFAIATQR